MKSFPTLLLLLVTALPLALLSQSLESQFDALMQAEWPADGPGATALVAVKGHIVYHKAFGQANLELEVPMRPEMVFEIASITKQFTAVAVLMLMEEGKLSLDDDLSKFLPDYPVGERTITVHHLLNHTSGIKSYTSMEAWGNTWRQDKTPQEMVDVFQDEPMDFEPGEAYSYNNSAYFLLGMVIEAASGMTYEEFIEQEIFAPLGMDQSRYGSQSEIIANRASGYQNNGEFQNTEYLSLTQPYAAGALMSTVEDLFTWNRAIRANTLVSGETIAKAFTNHTLNNGENINYGYGWVIDEIYGSRTLEHSGGIFGYGTNAIYAPEEDVFVAIFANCDCKNPTDISTRMAALALDKAPPTAADAVPVKAKYAKKLVGTYDYDDGTTRYVSYEDGQLYSQRAGSTKLEIYADESGTFFFPGEFSTVTFDVSRKGVNAVFQYRINKVNGHKTDRPVPVRKEVALTAAQLEHVVGVYALQPGVDVSFKVEDGQLKTQVTGQPWFDVFASDPLHFFLKVVEADIEFLEDASGRVHAMILRQGGLEMEAKRKG